VGLGVGLLQGASAPPHTHLGQVALSAQAQSCRLSPLTPPCVHAPERIYFSSHPFYGEWQRGHSCCHVWLASLGVCWAFLWIILAMAGVSTALFVFPPPLVGVELGHEAFTGASS
jgi:hypothetical protein